MFVVDDNTKRNRTQYCIIDSEKKKKKLYSVEYTRIFFFFLWRLHPRRYNWKVASTLYPIVCAYVFCFVSVRVDIVGKLTEK